MEYNESYVNFLDVWNIWVTRLAVVFVVGGILVSVYYFFKSITFSDPKDKHDFINANEINLFWYSMLSFSIGVGLWLNTIANDTV